MVSLFLHIVAMSAFVVSAFLVIAPLGWLTVGVGCLAMEYLTREDA